MSLRICHVTPHLPPDQAANALLPFQLGTWAADAGHEVTFISHPPRAGRLGALPGRAVIIPPASTWNVAARATKLAALGTTARILREAGPEIAAADLVHVHSNGLLPEVTALAAAARGKPVVLTLYGTEIWHYRPRRIGPDLFTRAYRKATQVTFYSQGLSARAQEIGLARHQTSVIYPPVAPDFQWCGEEEQAEVRAALGIRNRHLLVNVKRLHPLGGHRFLLDAMNEVIRTHPDARLVICGAGPLADELKQLARSTGVEGHVTFAGLVDNRVVAHYCRAADVFALPSLLEACPTVALEALACGTPVVAADSPGGVELNDLFGVDVTVVPREHPTALARAMVELLENKRRTRPSTRELIEREFRPAAVAAAFHAVYERALSGS